ncbi:hypothetical protein [Kitasatospora phosalacinea]|uniref:Uncharacterized protein n=1 Tax=Kitasatospora phosalacinea TaxID=2065 RepID=A0ABW6GR95_9ACTN
MSARDPFTGPEDRPSSWLVGVGETTPEQQRQARRTVARQALDPDDEQLLLAALGLDRQ